MKHHWFWWLFVVVVVVVNRLVVWRSAEKMNSCVWIVPTVFPDDGAVTTFWTVWTTVMRKTAVKVIMILHSYDKSLLFLCKNTSYFTRQIVTSSMSYHRNKYKLMVLSVWNENVRHMSSNMNLCSCRSFLLPRRWIHLQQHLVQTPHVGVWRQGRLWR